MICDYFKNKIRFTRFFGLVCLVWQFSMFWSMQQSMPIYINYTPKWTCNHTNYTSEDFSRNCTLFDLCPRENLQFEDPPFHSYIEEFGMQCGKKAYYAAVVTSFQFGGVFVGTVGFGHIADKFGRKKVAIFNLVLGMVAGTASAFSPFWQILVIFRFIIGMVVGGIITVCFAYCMEFCLPEQRCFVKVFFTYSIGRIICAGICYLVPYWRYALVITINIVGVPFLLLLIFLMPESPKWLESQERYKEKLEVEKWIAKFNGSPIESQESAAEIKQEDTPTDGIRLYTIKDLFATKTLAITTLTLSIMWFTTGVSSFALDLNMRNLGGNLFLNQVILGVGKTLSKLIYVFESYSSNFNRRRLHQFPTAAMIFLMLGMMAITLLKIDDVWVAYLNVFSDALLGYAWDANYLCSAELVPTVVRSIGLGANSAMARVGGVLAPQLDYLGVLWRPSPYVAVAVICGIALIVSCLFLRETKGKELETKFVKTDAVEKKYKVQEETTV